MIYNIILRESHLLLESDKSYEEVEKILRDARTKINEAYDARQAHYRCIARDYDILNDSDFAEIKEKMELYDANHSYPTYETFIRANGISYAEVPTIYLDGE